MSRVPEYVWVSKLTGNIVAEDGFVPTDGEYWERYRLAPPPPADAGKLPRRFLVKQPSRWIMGCYFPCGPRIVRVAEDGAMDSWLTECPCPSEHDGEIEWIDP